MASPVLVASVVIGLVVSSCSDDEPTAAPPASVTSTSTGPTTTSTDGSRAEPDTLLPGAEYESSRPVRQSVSANGDDTAICDAAASASAHSANAAMRPSTVLASWTEANGAERGRWLLCDSLYDDGMGAVLAVRFDDSSEVGTLSTVLELGIRHAGDVVTADIADGQRAWVTVDGAASGSHRHHSTNDGGATWTGFRYLTSLDRELTAPQECIDAWRSEGVAPVHCEEYPDDYARVMAQVDD